MSGALEQQIGNPGERRRHDDERTLMLRDQGRRLLNLVRRGERSAAELPDFERDA
jgi:hypothetical protein